LSDQQAEGRPALEIPELPDVPDLPEEPAPSAPVEIVSEVALPDDATGSQVHFARDPQRRREQEEPDRPYSDSPLAEHLSSGFLRYLLAAALLIIVLSVVMALHPWKKPYHPPHRAEPLPLEQPLIIPAPEVQPTVNVENSATNLPPAAP
jgi:hypothetical protein